MPLHRAYRHDVPPWIRHAVSAVGIVAVAAIGWNELRRDVNQFGAMANSNEQTIEKLARDVDERLDKIERAQDVMKQRFDGEARAQDIYREQTTRDLNRILEKLDSSERRGEEAGGGR